MLLFKIFKTVYFQFTNNKITDNQEAIIFLIRGILLDDNIVI